VGSHGGGVHPLRVDRRKAALNKLLGSYDQGARDVDYSNSANDNSRAPRTCSVQGGEKSPKNLRGMTEGRSGEEELERRLELRQKAALSENGAMTKHRFLRLGGRGAKRSKQARRLEGPRGGGGGGGDEKRRGGEEGWWGHRGREEKPAFPP